MKIVLTTKGSKSSKSKVGFIYQKKIIPKDDLEDDFKHFKNIFNKRERDINYIIPSSFALITALERLSTHTLSNIFLT